MSRPSEDLTELRDRGQLAVWEPAGRPVRTGSWNEQAVPTIDLIGAALAADRLDDAAALGRHLVVEAQEIHELFTSWVEAIPAILEREGVPSGELALERRRLLAKTGARDPDGDWTRFAALTETFSSACESGRRPAAELERLVEHWRNAHDRHCDLVAGWIDVAVERLGEDRLGGLWAELQADGIAAYERYDIARNPWSRSFALLLQTAIEGMHGHLGGPRRAGEVAVAEHDDRVELRFEACGSGGRIRATERFGVTTERHDWAWNEVGVCRYCVHCCLLMQLEPIERLGYPARVIDPPLAPGDACTWTVYRDPSLVPAEAYRRVGAAKPEVSHG